MRQLLTGGDILLTWLLVTEVQARKDQGPSLPQCDGFQIVLTQSAFWSKGQGAKEPGL